MSGFPPLLSFHPVLTGIAYAVSGTAALLAIALAIGHLTLRRKSRHLRKVLGGHFSPSRYRFSVDEIPCALRPMRWGLSLEIEMEPSRHFLRIFPAPKQNSSASSTTVHLPNGPISLETADTELRNRLPTKAGFLDAMATLFDATGPPGLCAQRLAWGRPPGVFGGFSGLAVFLQSNHLWREPDALREWVRTLALLFEEPTLAAAVRREAPSLSPAE